MTQRLGDRSQGSVVDMRNVLPGNNIKEKTIFNDIVNYVSTDKGRGVNESKDFHYIRKGQPGFVQSNE